MSLKNLFGSRARVKLLTRFLLSPDKEFFVRELSRDLDEQINGVRRELENLKKLGLLKSRARDRKKFYTANPESPIFSELRGIILKSLFDKKDIVKSITALGPVDFMLLSGVFTENKSSQVDLLIVGDIDRDTLADFVEMMSGSTEQIRYSHLTTENFLYRIEYQDSFVSGLLKDPKNTIALNKLKKILKTS